MPTLSLCMIVRDEAEMLPAFLAACEGLWDELCVVDTGSQDATITLLEAAGARIARRDWTGDFAAARNVSLELATGDWILFLDADERPGPQLLAEIRGLLDDPTAGAATVLMRNELPHGRVRESDLLRLFRRDPTIRFRHRIHEEVATTVGAYLQRSGRHLVHLRGPVQHLGYVRAVAAARDKKDRDRKLLTACIDHDARDWYSWYKLLELARFWDDRPLWQESARRLAPRLHQARLGGRPWGGELLALCAQGACEDPRGQLTLLDRWAACADPAAAYHLRRGTCLETVGDHGAAAAEFAHCLELPPGPDRTVGRVRPRLGMCRLAAAAGDVAGAQHHLAEALREGSRDPEALLAAIAFAWLTGGRAARDRFVADHPASAELTAAVGEHALSCGLWDDAGRAYGELAGQPPRGRSALRLAQAMLGGGEPGAALALCRDLVADLPVAALGMLVCGLTLGEDVDLTVDLDQSAADDALREWVAVLWRGRRLALLEGFLDHVPAVFAAFPWLPGELARLTQQLTGVR